MHSIPLAAAFGLI